MNFSTDLSLVGAAPATFVETILEFTAECRRTTDLASNCLRCLKVVENRLLPTSRRKPAKERFGLQRSFAGAGLGGTPQHRRLVDKVEQVD